MAVIDGGVSSAGKANVDANFNLNVVTPIVAAQAGYAALIVENDPGTVAGRSMRSLRVSENRRLMVGLETILFTQTFNNTAQNTSKWVSAVTNFVLAQTAGYVVFNSTSITTTTSSEVYQSKRYFALVGNAPLVFDTSIAISAAPPTNWTFECGLFDTAHPLAAPYAATDGVFFRLNATGLIGVVNYNGVETVTGTLIAAGSVLVNTNINLQVRISEDFVEFWAANNTAGTGLVLLGTIATPAANGQPLSSAAVPITFRLNQPGVASAGVQAKISDVTVFLGDVQSAKPWADQMAGLGQLAYEGQDGGTLGTSALYSNSLAPGAGAVMTNTTAALGSGLGGQFAALPTLAANTDGILCSFQNPQGSVTQTARTLHITGVRIQGTVTTVLAGNATPVIYAFSLAYGHTAVSMATAESIIAKAPRRVALGYESYGAAAALGTLGSTAGVSMQFRTPIVVNPGEFIAICAKNVGVVTTTGVITFLVTFDGYYE